MLDALVLNEMYSKIQKQLFYMIPEKWDKIYLYASVIDQINKLQIGEMFFYYFPKGLLKKNPVNVYEVPNKFNIDEVRYFALADKLYATIKELREKFEQDENKTWSNITISIENCKFIIEYRYENLLGSNYSSYDRHVAWKYKYLKLPIERFSKKERNMVEHYILDENFSNVEVKKDVQNVYNQKVNNIIDYNKEEVISRPIEVHIKDNKYTKEIPLKDENIQYGKNFFEKKVPEYEDIPYEQPKYNYKKQKVKIPKEHPVRNGIFSKYTKEDEIEDYEIKSMNQILKL